MWPFKLQHPSNIFRERRRDRIPRCQRVTPAGVSLPANRSDRCGQRGAGELLTRQGRDRRHPSRGIPDGRRSLPHPRQPLGVPRGRGTARRQRGGGYGRGRAERFHRGSVRNCQAAPRGLKGRQIPGKICTPLGADQNPVIHLYTDDQARSRGDACVAPTHQFVKRNDRSRPRHLDLWRSGTVAWSGS